MMRGMVAALACLLIAGCTTWEIPDDVAKKMGLEPNSANYVTFNQAKGTYRYCEENDFSVLSSGHCGDSRSKLNDSQISILREYLNPPEKSEDDTSTGAPPTGTVDTAVPPEKQTCNMLTGC